MAEAGEVETVDDADGAVAATGAEDGADSGVVQLPLEGEGAGRVVAGKLVVGVEKVVGQHHVKLPRTEQVDGGIDFGRGDFACRSDDGDAVAGF